MEEFPEVDRDGLKSYVNKPLDADLNTLGAQIMALKAVVESLIARVSALEGAS